VRCCWVYSSIAAVFAESVDIRKRRCRRPCIRTSISAIQH
jgi:hypothetical protein